MELRELLLIATGSAAVVMMVAAWLWDRYTSLH
jgi:hypothetical protein